MANFPTSVRSQWEEASVGNRPITDSAARVDIATAWSVDSISNEPGMNTDEMINSDLQALVIGGVDP
ncbi:MAG: hypothetical protein ACK55I_36180, partial [bacterium]